MRPGQDGIALLGLLALIVLGASWWLVSALATPANRVASDREHNAKVLAQAKVALIGTVGLMAGDIAEANPGRLPCPEAPGSANNGAGAVFNDADDGVAAGNCDLPALGRLPWRTLGIDKLTDASGEPLWYVVSPAWALSMAVPQTTINSQGPPGQLTLDGTGDVVALIIAPGRPLNIQAGGGCVARNQARVRVLGTDWDARDFLDCTNSDADAAFATNGPTGSFNDQVLAVTSGEVLPVIESAVADRFVRQMGANMRYCDGLWPACTGAGSAVYYPFAATFGNPATANYQGVLNLTEGLPPLSFSATGPCTVAGAFCNPPAACNPALDNRCAPALVTYGPNPTINDTGGGATLSSYNCAVAGTPSTLTCTLNTQHSIFTAVGNRWMTFTMDVTSNNVGMALRDVNAAVQMTGVQTAGGGTINAPYGYTIDSAAMNADGSATVRISARVPGGGGGLLADLICGLAGFLGLFFDCVQHTVTLPFIWVDEPMLSSNDATMQWWYRNGWHQLTYYAVAPGNAPSGAGACAGVTCLSVAGPTVTNTQRSVLVMPGRAVGLQARPPLALADWLEGGNADLNTVFAARDPVLAPMRAFNDHVVTLGSN